MNIRDGGRKPSILAIPQWSPKKYTEQIPFKNNKKL